MSSLIPQLRKPNSRGTGAAKIVLVFSVVCVFQVENGSGQEIDKGDDRYQQILKRLDALEKENRDLRSELEKSSQRQTIENPPKNPGNPAHHELMQSEIEVLKRRIESMEAEKREAGQNPELPGLVPRFDPLSELPAGVDGYFLRKQQQELEGESSEKPDRKFGHGEWKGGAYWESSDGSFKTHVGGRVDYDNTWYDVPKNMRFGNSNNIALNDGTSLRRLRLRSDGTFWSYVDYALEINFANLQDFANAGGTPQLNGSVGVTDAYLTFTKKPFLFDNIRVGHQKPWFGLEHTSSDNFTPYMERSPMFDAFVNRFDYVNGVSAFGQVLDYERIGYGLGFMRSGSGSINPFGVGVGDGGYAYNARFFFVPVWNEAESKAMHLGASYFFRVLDFEKTSPGNRPLVRAGAGNIEVPNVIATGNFYSFSGAHNFSPELAIVRGPFSLSSEYLLVNYPYTYVEKVGSKGNPGYFRSSGPGIYHGMYVEAGYFLTHGDHRNYSKSIGVWDRITPKRPWRVVTLESPEAGFGAIELVARYTYLDLVSGDPVLTQTAGARAGVENDMTLGINWHLNPNSRLMINYVTTWIRSVDPTASGMFQGLGVRLHFDF
jgi:phosphate-selective porin OprO/OprP